MSSRKPCAPRAFCCRFRSFWSRRWRILGGDRELRVLLTEQGRSAALAGSQLMTLVPRGHLRDNDGVVSRGWNRSLALLRLVFFARLFNPRSTEFVYVEQKTGRP